MSSETQPDELKRIIKALEAGNYSEDDLQKLARIQMMSIASGDRAVSIKGNADEAIIVTGDGNQFTVKGASAKAVKRLETTVDQNFKNLDASIQKIYKGSGNTQKWLILLAIMSLILVAIALPNLAGVNELLGLLRPPTQPEVMKGIFNVAIAKFGDISPDATALPTESIDANHIFLDISETLTEELGIVTDNTGEKINIKTQSALIPLIPGKTDEDRYENAATLAQKINADVLIYGYIEHEGSKAFFVPQFYISPRLVGADEVTSDGAFGQKIDVRIPLATNADSRFEFDAKFSPRLKALTYFMIGLAYIKVKQPEKALEWLKRADQLAAAWPIVKDYPQGKEILYLWIGTTFHQYHDWLIKEGREDAGDRCWLEEGSSALQCARVAYEKATGPDGGFARAYIGLGNLVMDEYPSDCEAYTAAGGEYSKAVALVTQNRTAAQAAVNFELEAENPAPQETAEPNTAFVELRARYNLGLLYANTYRDHLGCSYPIEIKQGMYDTSLMYLKQAEGLYKQVADKEPLAREIGADIYYQLGTLYQSADHYVEAAEAFSMSISIASPDAVSGEENWQAIRWAAYHMRGYVYSMLAKQSITGDVSWQEKALADFDTVIAVYRSSGLNAPEIVSSVFLRAGQIHEARKETSRAIENYQTAISIADDSADVDNQALQEIRYAAQQGLERLGAQP